MKMLSLRSLKTYTRYMNFQNQSEAKKRKINFLSQEYLTENAFHSEMIRSFYCNNK